MDEARRFNVANGLRMIVRSHELVQRGWAIGGKKDVITVFSAADYRNKGNDGAVPDLHSVRVRVENRVGFLVTPCGFLWSSLQSERRCGIPQGCCRDVDAVFALPVRCLEAADGCVWTHRGCAHGDGGGQVSHQGVPS